MSEFVVSARKYRPLRWADVIGQEHVATTLKNALAKSQIAHAFLFCGPRGVGKTTCARILARVLNCSQPSADWEPCNACPSCLASMENASFNIFELDAASNNSVDDIRELVDQVRYQPQAGKYKVYIVDEVHMLSTQAFNAFLKTLEEPPPFAKFILATTEKHKIIPTILSRCQVYDFRRIGEKDIVRQLQRIAEVEHLGTDEEALYLIAQKADGAMRDALSMFDRIRSFSGNALRYTDVLENLNVLDYDYFFKFADAILEEDVRQAMLLVDEVLQRGFDPDVLIEGLAGHLRNLMVAKDPAMFALFSGSENLRLRYSEQAKACSWSGLTGWLDLVHESDVNLVRARNKRLHAEILVIKLCHAGRKTTRNASEELIPVEKKNELSQGSSPISPPEPETPSPAKPFAPPKIAPPPPKQEAQPEIPRLGSLEDLKTKILVSEQKRREQLIPFNPETAQAFWDQLLESELPASLKACMKLAQYVVEDHAVRILVGGVIARETIRSELHLDDRLRATFADKNLRFYVEIDPTMASAEAKKPVKYYSGKEKYELMVEKNPHLAAFREKMQLRLNED
ncbi:MAG: DNA polymerase III subunit gamma/tau [Saprospiraceae bacterium]|jgi:DNA polymerase-3 subunit gamma/tau|nr:DNA polymerase III subunit gamma/tau [Saprospiraceae bacterium]MBP9209779.1 DNA polymerase III subunit gamma/tau [Saprospiraceae bacterium]MBV6473335.1 Holliday junction ATP-dependent DNA helicase RuvB [Saprospiraceae bacterium]